MVALFDRLTLGELGLLSLVAYVLHYAEEGPLLVAWFRDGDLFRGRGIAYDQAKLNLENLLLFSFTAIVVLLSNVYPASEVVAALALGPPVGFLANTHFHVVPTLRTGIYSPGVVTASMLNPPLFIAYFFKANQLGLLTWPIALAAVAVGLLALPLFVLLTHRVLLARNRPALAFLAWFPVRERAHPTSERSGLFALACRCASQTGTLPGTCRTPPPPPGPSSQPR